MTKKHDRALHLRGWANILGKDDVSADLPHNHLPYHWSAVYYAQVPALTAGEGSLLLLDPREVFFTGQPVSVTPQTGMFVMFPSWLRHTVVPLRRVTDDRISISLNAIIGPNPNEPAPNFPPPPHEEAIPRRIAGPGVRPGSAGRLRLSRLTLGPSPQDGKLSRRTIPADRDPGRANVPPRP